MGLDKFTSTTGYKADSPDRHRPMNIIESGNITMNNVPHPVLGIDNLGNSQLMQPGSDYQFPGQQVTEYPMAALGIQVGGGYNIDEMNSFQDGGYVDMELDDTQIANLRSKGIRIEEL